MPKGETDTGLSPEALHLGSLVDKCKGENNPHRLLDHLQAVKTLLVAHLVQQSTLGHQLRGRRIVEGELEDRIIEECQACVGETKKVVRKLHHFLREYEDQENLDSMGFRVSASQLLSRFDKSLNNFKAFFERIAAN